jgi:hypothetical protein
VVLPQPEPVIVPGGKVADVQRDPGERRHLRHLSLREEPIGDATLIEYLDRARVQTARTRAGEFLAGAPLDNRNVDSRQRQLACEHQPCRAPADDNHRVPGLCRTHFVPPSQLASAGVLRNDRGLEASPLHATYQCGG